MIATSDADLRALLEFAHSDPSCVNLHGICVSEGRLAATNGHALAILGDDHAAPWTERFLLPWDSVAVASARLSDRHDPWDFVECDVVVDPIEIEISASSYKIIRRGVTVSGPTPSTQFPDAGAIVTGQRCSYEPFRFDAALLAKLDSITNARHGNSAWQCDVAGSLQPLRFTGGRWGVYVMPMRPGGDL